LAVHQKIAFTFCTQWLFSGDGAAYGARQLAKKGFIVLWQAHFMMPNNITDLRILDHKSPYDYSKIATSVHKKAKRLVQAIIDHREQRFGSNVFSLLLGLTQRFPFEKMDRVAFARAVNIKDVWCTRCGICVKLCPTKNLFKDQNKIQTLGNCTLCYRCVNHCPTQAIRLATKQRVKYPYLGPTQAFDIKNLGKDIVLDTITNVQK
jgi:ferredoxin